MIIHSLMIVSIVGYVKSNEITVNPNNGNNTINCLLGKVACKDLHYVFTNGLTYLNESKVILQPAFFNISYHYEIRYIHNFTMISKNATLKCTNKGNGFTFIGSSNILLKNITFTNCGASHKSTTILKNSTNIIVDQPVVYIALDFIYCKYVVITMCNFIENYGIGLASYNGGEVFEISHSVFKNNSNVGNRNDSEMFISGGGVYIEYTLCEALEPYTCYEFIDYNVNAKISISRSLFQDNRADDRYGLSLDEGKINSSYMTFGDGGGVSINFFGNASLNDIDIHLCEFINNTAMWGAGVCVTLKDEAERNTIDIFDSYFYGNNATYAGGGVRIESLYTEDFNDIYEKTVSSGNSVNLHCSNYSNNIAILGAGISITATTRLLYVSNNSSRDVLIENCTFLGNKATIGYAIGLNTINLNKDIIGPGMSYRVRVKDSQFLRNIMVLTEDKKVIGHGCLYSDQVTLVFAGENHFISNRFTAVVLDSSSLLFEKYSSTNFDGNSGFEGGAIALFGLSWLMFGYQSNVTFKNNKAQSKGGAIYAKSGSPPRLAFNTTVLSTIQCFFRYENHNVQPDNWPVKVTFNGNRSPNGTGNAVYASTLQYCRSQGTSRENVKALNWKPFVYKNNYLGQAEIVTNAIDLHVNTDDWDPYPSLPFSPQVTMLDEKHQSVYGSVKLVLSKNSGVNLDPPNNNFLIRDKLARLRIRGKVKAKFAFHFISASGQLFRSNNFNGSMKQCPPGFRPDKEGDRCVCMDAENSDVIKCYENGTVYILKGKWGYLDNEGVLKTVPCPPHVCGCKNEVADYLCELDLDNQCIEGRNGTLCGQCYPGHSVLLGNEGCEKCGYRNLYIIIVCFILGMPLFIMVILYFDFDAFSGYLNAFLYSYQMFTILVNESVDLDPVISFIIGITSFAGTGGNFGICLYDGMDNISKLGLNYVLPASLIFHTCAIGIGSCSGFCGCIWKCIFPESHDNDGNEVRRRSFGRAFSFFSVLFYSSITETTFRIFRRVKINDKAYLFGAPGTPYFAPLHILLFVIACFLVLFVIVVFPLLLIFQTRFSENCRFFRQIEFIVTALKICFKVEYRSFAAFYFICRIVLLSIDSLVQEQVSRLIVLACCCVIILVIFTYFQPYELWTHNVFDVVILSNLTLISLLIIILNVPFSLEDKARDIVATLCHILVWFPLIITLCRFLSLICNKKKEEKRRNGEVECFPARVMTNLNRAENQAQHSVNRHSEPKVVGVVSSLRTFP